MATSPSFRKKLSLPWVTAILFMATFSVWTASKYYPKYPTDVVIHASNDPVPDEVDGQGVGASPKWPLMHSSKNRLPATNISDQNQYAALVAQRAIALANRFLTDESFKVLFDRLDLDDVDRDALINQMAVRDVVLGEGLRANEIQKWSHDVRFTINGKTHDASVYTGDVGFLDQMTSDLYAPVDNQIHGLLGDSKFSIFEYYIDTYPYRALADYISSYAKTSNLPDFTQEQKEVFISAMASNNAFKSNYLDTEIPSSVINSMENIVTPEQLKIIADVGTTNAELNRLSLEEAKKYQTNIK